MEFLTKIGEGIMLTVAIGMSFLGYVPNELVQNQQILEQKINALEESLDKSETLGGYNPSGGGTYRLRSSIGTTNSTVYLSSFKEPVSNTPYTLTYLNTDVFYATIDPQTTRSEFVSATGITQNSDGTATLTGVTRGLTRSPAGSTCTASTTLAQSHSSQSIFILSDSPCHFAEYAVKRNNETLTGLWSVPTPVSAANIATKAYVDSVVGGITTTEKITVTATAGETIAAGQLVAQRRSDGEWYKVDTDLPVTLFDSMYGIAQGSGTDGVAISGGVLIKGLDTNQSGLTIGAPYFAGSTVGVVSSATSSKSIGVARTSTNLYIDPSPFINSTSTSYTGAFPTYNIGKNEFFSSTTGAGTFTRPQGITKIWFEMVAGGGGGYGASIGAGDSFAGGAGGGYCSGILDISSFPSLTYMIGSGGAGGPVGTAAASGTASYLTSGSTIFCGAAGGGGGGVAGTGTSTGGVATTTISTVTTWRGQGGSLNLDAGAVGVSGIGGDSMMGLGGAAVSTGVTNGHATGTAATGFGAGGGAAIGSATAGDPGGAGSGGALKIRW